ncbi:MAG: aspartate aminotransferase family protein, partial [Gammaproteobacteria bacterium]|nr:aspartate aminotransferase family protein [Gammaproteobacteria bacterium]
GAPGRRGNLLQKRLFDAGLHIKTTGDAGLLAPAFIVEKDQIDEMVEILKQELIRL